MLRKLMTVPCGEVTRREPVAVKQSDTLGRVVELMAEKRRGAVLIDDDAGKLAGIFTEHDLMCRVDLRDSAWRGIEVAKVMTPNPVCVSRDEPVSRALKLLHQGRFRRLAEVDQNGGSCGILSIRDIIRYMAETFPEEFVNLPPDPQHEASSRWGG